MLRPLERFVRSKAVSIDGERLLLAVCQQESDCRFVFGFRRNHLPLTGTTVGDNEYWWLVPAIRTTPA
jgi:hypothetical protein